MTMTPEPTDKLDAATNVAVNGPADERASTTRGSYGLAPPNLQRLA